MNAMAGEEGASSSMAYSFAALLIASILTGIFVILNFVGGYWVLAAAPLLKDGLVLIVWLIAAAGIGLWILRAIKIECSVVLRLTIATALGLGTISLVTLGLGCAGILNRWSAIGILVAGVMGALVLLRGPTAKPWAFLKSPARFHWIWVLLVPLGGMSILCALIPPGILWGDEPAGYDVTEYHLQVPREWFEAGRIIPLHHNVFSYMPFNVEMHYLLAMHLLGGPWAGMYLAQLMHVGFVALSVLAIYALLAERHPHGAIVAAVLAGATPWMTLLAPVAYNEGGLLLFGTLAVGLAIRSLREAQPVKWMLLAGAMAGFACGSKLTAVTMICVPLAIIIAVGLFIKRKHRTSSIEHSTSNQVQRAMFDVECSVFSAFCVFCLSSLLTFSPG